eukprot:SAG11_NODE_1440_length_4905_cov_6.216188_7_plen_102_part_00
MEQVAMITREDLLAGVPLGTCLENRDPAAIFLSVMIITLGSCSMIWCAGWCVKDSGRMATLRRYGVAAEAEVLGKHIEAHPEVSHEVCGRCAPHSRISIDS